MTASFDWVLTTRGLELLRDDWSRLDQGGPGAVFRSWEWQATWWRHLGEDPRRRRALRILVVREGGGVVALLPAYVEDAAAGARRLRLLADGVVGSDYLGLVAPPPDATRLARQIAARLRSDPLLADVDLLQLTDLLEDDPLAAGLADEGGWADLTRGPRYVCPHAQLGPERDAYLASRPNGFGGQLRDRSRRLSREPGYRLDIHDRPDEVVAALEDLFRLHRRRWAEEGGSQAFTDGRVEAFHRASGRLLAERGLARLAVLSARGEPVAAGYGFARGDVFAYYQAGIDPAWRRLSAGTVVLGALLDRAFAEGIRELDFLRGEEPYKAIWATGRRATVAFAGHRRSVAAFRALAVERGLAGARRILRRTLPDRARNALRRFTSRWSAGGPWRASPDGGAAR